MVRRIQGNNYSFEVVSKNEGKNFCFFIKAIDEVTGRFSCVNNLNAILSEFDVGIDDPRVEDSMWVVTKESAHHLEETGNQFLWDSSFLDYFERQLDEDRRLGEWENVISSIS